VPQDILETEQRNVTHDGKTIEIEVVKPKSLLKFEDYHEAMLKPDQSVIFGTLSQKKGYTDEVLAEKHTLKPTREAFVHDQEAWKGRTFWPEQPGREDTWSEEKNLAFMAGAIKTKKKFELVTPFSFYFRKVAKFPEGSKEKTYQGVTWKELTWIKDNNYIFELSSEGLLEAIPPQTNEEVELVMRHGRDIATKGDLIATAKYIAKDIVETPGWALKDEKFKRTIRDEKDRNFFDQLAKSNPDESARKRRRESESEEQANKRQKTETNKNQQPLASEYSKITNAPYRRSSPPSEDIDVVMERIARFKAEQENESFGFELLNDDYNADSNIFGQSELPLVKPYASDELNLD